MGGQKGFSKSELEAWDTYQRSHVKVTPEPEVHNEFWSYGEYELVGHGKQTNEKCGTFNKFMGCLKVDLHNQVRWYFQDLEKDAVFVKPIYHSCDKPTCPICYKHGWSVREAGRMEKRLLEASKRLGLIEHIVVSAPTKEHGLSLEQLRQSALRIMANRGIIGGSMIFHGFRYRNRYVARKTGLPQGWYWNPHFHVLGFIGGEGYGKCRTCKFQLDKTFAECRACKGFEGITRNEYEKDGWIVKVLEKRKTVGGTCWYQLNHCSIRRGSKKSHAVTWFGACSYRKLKLINGEDVGVKHKCPICACDLVRVRYLGDFSALMISRRGETLNMYGDDGAPLWEVVVGKKFKGG